MYGSNKYNVKVMLITGTSYCIIPFKLYQVLA